MSTVAELEAELIAAQASVVETSKRLTNARMKQALVDKHAELIAEPLAGTTGADIELAGVRLRPQKLTSQQVVDLLAAIYQIVTGSHIP